MPNMKETRETGGKIQNKEWLALKKILVRAELMENLKQRLKQAELINQRHEEQEKTLKKRESNIEAEWEDEWNTTSHGRPGGSR